MSRPNTGWYETRKVLWCALILTFVIILICQSSLWAGPMGDPEPADQNCTLGEGTNPDYGEKDEVSSVMSHMELALLLAGLI